jgi:SAM-dependent methyltransferase
MTLKHWLVAAWRHRPIDIVRRRPRPKWPEDANRFIYQQKFVHFDIPPGSIVLDIGSGDYPFPHATILSDLYITEELVRDPRPFLILDIHHLPFRDKSIDFIYCSHVLEHVDDPDQACSELMRVGHRGYIETPTFAKDMLFSWAQGRHKWHVVAINNKLIFFEYNERQKQGVRSSVWRELILGLIYHPLQDLFYDNPDLFNVMFTWNEQFECIVYRLDKAQEVPSEL